MLTDKVWNVHFMTWVNRRLLYITGSDFIPLLLESQVAIYPVASYIKYNKSVHFICMSFIKSVSIQFYCI